MKNIYAIRDRIANDLAGYYPLSVFRTDAQAVRYFADSLAQEKGALAMHPSDYELIRLGRIEENGDMFADGTTVIITGDALIAATTEHQPQLVKES